MIDITYRIQEACDNGQYACGIYKDFKKAFDTVNHNILIGKLISPSQLEDMKIKTGLKPI